MGFRLVLFTQVFDVVSYAMILLKNRRAENRSWRGGLIFYRDVVFPVGKIDITSKHESIYKAYNDQSTLSFLRLSLTVFNSAFFSARLIESVLMAGMGFVDF